MWGLTKADVQLLFTLAVIGIVAIIISTVGGLIWLIHHVSLSVQ